MMDEKKITWCENWIRKTFEKYPSIERNFLFEMAFNAGLYTQGAYGSDFSAALSNVGIKAKSVSSSEGEFLYHALYI